MLLLLGFLKIIICVGESFCCHCQSLTEGTMGPDRWKKPINSRPILEFEVLPSWHERASFLESAYCLEKCSQRWKMNKSTGNLFFILQCTNSIFHLLPGSKLFPAEEIIPLVFGYSLKTISHVQANKHPGTCSFMLCIETYWKNPHYFWRAKVEEQAKMHF